MDIITYKEYIKSITEPAGLIFRLYMDTQRYVKESHVKWVQIENASLLCKDYKKEAEYDKIEAEEMRFRQEYLINYICKKYGERHRCALLNLIIATERKERESIDRFTTECSRSSSNKSSFQEGVNYCSLEHDSMDERVELLMQEIVKELVKEKEDGQTNNMS